MRPFRFDSKCPLAISKRPRQKRSNVPAGTFLTFVPRSSRVRAKPHAPKGRSPAENRTGRPSQHPPCGLTRRGLTRLPVASSEHTECSCGNTLSVFQRKEGAQGWLLLAGGLDCLLSWHDRKEWLSRPRCASSD